MEKQRHQKILNFQVNGILGGGAVSELVTFGKEWACLTCSKDNEPNVWWWEEQSVWKLVSLPISSFPLFLGPCKDCISPSPWFGQWNVNRSDMCIYRQNYLKYNSPIFLYLVNYRSNCQYEDAVRVKQAEILHWYMWVIVIPELPGFPYMRKKKNFFLLSHWDFEVVIIAWERLSDTLI